MRGVTNALPAGGGLKVIAEGMISKGQTVTLPSRAAFVFIATSVLMGSVKMYEFVVAVRGWAPSESSDGEYTIGLSADGRTLTDSSSSSSQKKYVAYG